MKKVLLLITFCIVLCGNAFSQISVSLATGALPTLSAGWVLNGTATVPAAAPTTIQLTTNTGSQNGQVYYNSLLDVTACGQFSVDFDYQIGMGSAPQADGIAFWFINPLSGFTAGGGLGLPTNPNGMVLVFDTYNNTGPSNIPLISLEGYPAGFVGNYTEDDATYYIAPALASQANVYDYTWRHVYITYNAGNIKVYLNNSTTPSMTGFFSITTPGYFGFSGSTGASYSKQSIRNVYINSNSISPIAGPTTLCMGSPTTYTDLTTGGAWSSSNPAVGTINAATGVFTPLSAGTTTIGYFYSSTCNTSTIITVNPAVATITGASSVCTYATTTLTDATAGGTWTSSNTAIATIGTGSGIVTGIAGGTVTITYTLPVGCIATKVMTVNIGPSPLTISPSPATVCNNGTLTLTASGTPASFNLIPVESWEAGVPTTSAFTWDGWGYIGGTTNYWFAVNGSLSANPATTTAAVGTYAAQFNSHSLVSGAQASLYSPSFSLTGFNGGTVSFWVYRDNTLNTAVYDAEAITVRINTTAAVGGTVLATIPRRRGLAATGIASGTAAPGAAGWYQYTCNIPNTFTGATNYILFTGNSVAGDNQYLDNVAISGNVGAPIWSPSLYLFNDAGATSAYIGAATNTVYMHPTGILAVTPFNYNVSLSAGTCSSSGTTTVTINPNPVAITGSATTCVSGTTTLADATTGGTWSTTSPNASVGSATGIVTGLIAGTATISYSIGTCYTTVVVTVTASASPITGTLSVCTGLNTTLADASSGGTWSISNTNASVSATGVVTGAFVGTATVTYSVGTSCVATATVTVNLQPAAITGNAPMCAGSSVTLADGTAGGVWSSVSTGVATVGTGGIVTGVSGSSGTSVISYTLGSCAATVIATVNVQPAAITGTPSVCAGLNTTLADATAGGVWTSVITSVATVTSPGGVVTGLPAGGTSTISYTIGSCASTVVVTVNTVAPITGTAFVCAGLTTTLSDATAGGTWGSSTLPVATTGSGSIGVVFGISAGTSTITYTSLPGCITTTVVTVNASPSPITGSLYVCTGVVTSLADITIGGTWISGTTASATVGTAGDVLGVALGTSTITYSLGAGCITTAIVTVNTSPAPILGTAAICGGTTLLLTDATTPGTWSASPGATIGSSSGIVTAGAGGTSTVTYTIPPVGSAPSCISTTVVTINPLPAAIGGPTSVCQNSAVTETDATLGGTWTSSAPGFASIDPSTGSVTGILSGTTTISYTLGTGCYRTRTFTVNPIPASISGGLVVCQGSTTTATDASPGGTWSTSSGGAIASVGSSTGIVTGISGSTGGSIDIISYTFPVTGCYIVSTFTVNPYPSAISGVLTVCPGTTTALSDPDAGGAWVSSNPGVATIDPSTGLVTGVLPGGVAAVTSTITYTLPTTCKITAVLTVNPLPSSIGGTLSVCQGLTTNVSDPTLSGTWSTGSAIITIGSSTGLVTAAITGVTTAATATITYTLSATGCYSTAVITVNPLPAAITGLPNVCIGYTTTLTDVTGSGTWISSNTAIATIGSSNGIVNGIGLPAVGGTATITYKLTTTGCINTTTVTVNPLPGAITGNVPVCVGNTITLGNSSSGGNWTSSTPFIATVGTSSGIVTGVSGGTATITYTIGSGCYVTAIVTVNPLPATIGGAIPIVCVGSTIVLTETTPPAGTWTIGVPYSAAGVATIGSGSGVVVGSASGTTTVTYTHTGTGCLTTTIVTVNPVPGAVTGTLTLCPGTCTTLNDVTPGGTWVTSSGLITAVGGTANTGIVCGLASGTATVSYVLSATGCYKAAIATVNPTPNAITGTMTVCVGSGTLLSTTSTGGTWSSGNLAVGTVSPGGVVTGISAGTVLISYINSTTLCYTTTTVTVNPLPLAITGTLTVCPGTCTTLSDVTSGGTWTNVSGAVNVGSASGIVCGIASGTATVTYTLTATGCKAMSVVTINPLPTAIGGTLTVCPGTITTLSDASSGGTWSSTSGNVTVTTTGVSTGAVTGVIAGTATITYTLPTGCLITTDVTVNPLPAAITGGLAVCVGLTTTLNDITTPGTWTSGTTSVASIGSASGIATGITVGTTTITYTISTGCISTAILTVNGLPPAIGVPGTICPGTTMTLSDAAVGGTWTSGNTAVATIDVSSGIVTGITSGTAPITYTFGTGCIVIGAVSVNSLPAAIAGTLSVCEGLAATVTDATSGGTWSSSNTAVGTINSSTGVITGITYGTTTITYKITATGCYMTAVATINPLPAPITGSSGFCNLTSTTLHDATPGGTWSSGDPSIFTIVATTGDITGVNQGTAMVTYTDGNGCITSRPETIILAPYPITGPDAVCVGSTISLGNVIAGGTWVSTDPSIADVGYYSGVVTGYSVGTATDTYTLSTGCFSTFTVTVNLTPAVITGTKYVCQGLTTTLFESTSGGTWSTSDATIAPVDASGVVTGGTMAGTATISYIMPTGCYAATGVTVNPIPAPITGLDNVCLGLAITLSDDSTGGTWSSSDPGTANINSTSGILYGLGAGTATIIYILPTSCQITRDVTVNPLPDAITGPTAVCLGLTITLNDATSGGAWLSGDPSVATIDLATGVITGMGDGVATITYVLPTGCLSTYLVTVNGLPPAITGTFIVCAGFTTNLSNAVSGGTWVSSDPSVATIGSATGVVSGIMAGTSNITYTLPTGCQTYAAVLVDPLPAPINGLLKVCEGLTTALSDPDAGGTWSSSNASIATIDNTTGLATGINAGTAHITYTLAATGCFNLAVLTVNPNPAAITGTKIICEGSQTALSDATSGGSWISGNGAVATIGYASGIVTGMSGGTATITYVLNATGCINTTDVTVNPLPAPITGPAGVCFQSTVTLSDAISGGTWISSNPSAATIGSANGIVNGIALGTTTITYQLTATNCLVTKLMTVNALPDTFHVTGNGSYCAGGNGVHIGLSGSAIGISYVVYYGPSGTGYLAGTGNPLDFGLMTVAGTYTVLATNALTGCSSNMNGSGNVIIDPLVTPAVTINTGVGDTVCPGSPTTFTADTVNAGGIAATYLWKVNGTSVGTLRTYSYIPANGDVVTVRLISTAHCVMPAAAYDTMRMTVIPTARPVADISVDPGDTVCEFSSATFTASSLFGGAAPHYDWFKNGSFIVTGPVYSYVPINGDVVYCRLVSNYQCRTADTVVSTNVIMSVQPLTIPHVVITSHPGLSIDSTQIDSLTTTVINAGSHPAYQWQINGVPIPGATQSSFASTFNDYDSVTCIVTSSDVCHGVSTFDWVFISLHPSGVSQATAASDVRLVPNPNSGVFTIRGTLGTTADEEVSLEITDMLGQVVYHNKVMTHGGKLNEQVKAGSTLANGMYILNLRSAEGYKTFHFVIEQ